MDNDDSFTPRGNSEPDNSPMLPVSNRLLFTLAVTQDPLDYLLIRYGVLPSDDIRLAVAQEFNQQSTVWIDSVVKNWATRITSNN